MFRAAINQNRYNLSIRTRTARALISEGEGRRLRATVPWEPPCARAPRAGCGRPRQRHTHRLTTSTLIAQFVIKQHHSKITKEAMDAEDSLPSQVRAGSPLRVCHCEFLRFILTEWRDTYERINIHTSKVCLENGQKRPSAQSVV